ncbi:phosphoglucosamine mutase [Wenzhouxiangella sp. EGI_FJ10305]|uniref:phosphoglucosamine mutase n=1 Tax=Wenzhouxiangella sp. EGI_FJ10305 TaxID=3243768 RepID=UPI0035D8F555
MKYFGTDGIRGRVGEPPITADFILKLGWAAGRVLAEEFGEDTTVVIGKDTRISGYLFESALEAGFSAAGVDILILGPMPTPAIAHLTRSMHAAAGVVISASHNPFEDNGIKFFSREGQKLSDDLQTAIEERLEQPFEQVSPEFLGKAWRMDDAVGRYVEYCKGTVTWGTRLDSLRIVVDCANGATYRIAPEVFRELGAEVISIFDQPDGLNINRECGSTHPGNLARMVTAERADLGVAFDGDGDRVLMVDHRGDLVDGDQILYVLAAARQANGGLEGGIVGTVMSNFGLEQAMKEQGIEFVRSAVGDRNVHDALVERGWVLGGESSGHILCLDRATTGCGIVSALQVLEVIARSGRRLAELTDGMTKCPQVMINVPSGGNGRAVLDGNEEIGAAVRRVENELGGEGRVILRPSGTEPLVRVTVEGFDAQQVQRLAEELAGSVKQVLTA